jgi:xanthine dehydrogenase accessory factor
MSSSPDDPACEAAHGHAPTPDEIAHGATPPAADGRVLVVVFASPVAEFLLRYGSDAGFLPVLVEPDPERARAATLTASKIESGIRNYPAGSADVVVTDHHRPELGVMLRDALASDARWVGIMGSPRHRAPHPTALASLGVPADEIARVHRPIGLNIGSRTPAEIAISTLAGLIADRNGRPGGFSFQA